MPRTVLLADDSVTAQNMGRRILTDAGYEVITVNNGSAALKKIHENPPDLIVLDVYMPGYGGLEVCQRLKESGPTMKIPVLLTVGKMEPFKTDDAKRVRADGHIVKPFDATELLAALTRLEDRIVPPSAPARSSAKPPEKKRWFWHTEEPAPAPESSDWPDDTAAEIKYRQELAPTSDAARSGPAEPAAAAHAAPDQRATPEQGGMFSTSRPASVAVVDTSETTEPPLEVALAALNSEPIAAARPEKVEPTGEGLVPEFSVQAEPASVPSEPASSAPVEETQSGEPAEPAPAPAAKAVHWVAEKVELTPQEAALSLEVEMRRQEAAMAARENHAEPVSNSAEGEATTPAGEASQPIKAAAAAAAATPQAAATPEAMIARAEVPEETAPRLPSEAQAAWENWQQIRDSVMQPVEAMAKAAEIAKPETTDESDKSAGVAPVLESAALASIVDSVLAELKPRLMEEIAKKLAPEKK